MFDVRRPREVASLAPAQGGTDVVHIKLSWITGELIPGYWHNGVMPFSTVKSFVEDLEAGRCPGVPALRERSEKGRYKLLWGTRCLDEKDDDQFHLDLGIVSFSELRVVFCCDEASPGPRHRGGVRLASRAACRF